MSNSDIDDGREPPHERLARWDDAKIHRVRVSPRMLDELLCYGQTTTAGTSLVGPELLVLDYLGDDHVSPANRAVGVHDRLADIREVLDNAE